MKITIKITTILGKYVIHFFQASNSCKSKLARCKKPLKEGAERTTRAWWEEPGHGGLEGMLFQQGGLGIL